MFDINQLKSVCDKKLFNHLAEHFTDDLLQAAEGFSYVDHGHDLTKSLFFHYREGEVIYYAYFPDQDGCPGKFDQQYFSKQEIAGLADLLKKTESL